MAIEDLTDREALAEHIGDIEREALARSDAETGLDAYLIYHLHRDLEWCTYLWWNNELFGHPYGPWRWETTPTPVYRPNIPLEPKSVRYPFPSQMPEDQ